MTPSGTPASVKISAITWTERGDSGAGLSSTVQAGEQCGGQLVDRQEQRDVPGQHGGDDADGLTGHLGLPECAGALLFPRELVGQLGVVAQRRHRRGLLHHADHGGRLAHLVGDELVDFRAALFDQLGGLGEDRAALGGGGA